MFSCNLFQSFILPILACTPLKTMFFQTKKKVSKSWKENRKAKTSWWQTFSGNIEVYFESATTTLCFLFSFLESKEATVASITLSDWEVGCNEPLFFESISSFRFTVTSSLVMSTFLITTPTSLRPNEGNKKILASFLRYRYKINKKTKNKHKQTNKHIYFWQEI